MVILGILKFFKLIDIYIETSFGFLSLGIVTFLTIFYFNNAYSIYKEHYIMLEKLNTSFIMQLVKFKTNTSCNHQNINNLIIIYKNILHILFEQQFDKNNSQISLNNEYTNSYYLLYKINLDNNNDFIAHDIWSSIVTNINNIISYKGKIFPEVYKSIMLFSLYVQLFIINIVYVSTINVESNNLIDIIVAIIYLLIVIFINIVFISIKNISDKIIDPYGNDSIDFSYDDNLNKIKQVFLKLMNLEKKDTDENDMNEKEVNDLFDKNKHLNFEDMTVNPSIESTADSNV
jgi:hypothetical protein